MTSQLTVEQAARFLQAIGGAPREALPLLRISVSELQKQSDALLELGDVLEQKAEKLARELIGNGAEKSAEVIKLFTYLIREMLRNTPEHAGCDEIWFGARLEPAEGAVEIMTLDEGCGVQASLSHNPAHRWYITNGQKALAWAMKAGISKSFQPAAGQRSQNPWANSGFGLFMISEISRLLQGSFTLLSEEDYVHVDAGGTRFGKACFHGTALRLSLPVEKKQVTGRYALPVGSAQRLISQALASGEAQAKTIRNAFKKASLPSRGLMSELGIEGIGEEKC